MLLYYSVSLIVLLIFTNGNIILMVRYCSWSHALISQPRVKSEKPATVFITDWEVSTTLSSYLASHKGVLVIFSQLLLF